MPRRYKHKTVKIQVEFYVDIELYLVPLALQFDCTLFNSGPFFNYFTHETYLLAPSDRAFVMSTRKSESGTKRIPPRGNETFRHNYA